MLDTVPDEDGSTTPSPEALPGPSQRPQITELNEEDDKTNPCEGTNV